MIFGNQAAEKTKTDAATINLAVLVPLFREISNLKRIHCADSIDSFAANLFSRAWRAINGGADARTVALNTTSNAVVAANLGGIERRILLKAGLDDAEIETILFRAFDTVAAPIEANLRKELRAQISRQNDFITDVIPGFVKRLMRQPRSGATKVGEPKLMLNAPENHAEHSIVVGVYAVLLAPLFDAEIETVFFAALAHHFHNAYLPDSGFAGEESLGEFLPQIFEAFRNRCLTEVSENLHEKIRYSLQTIETAQTPEARAFHAADVIDRILQMRHHAEANEFTLSYALEEAELVHAGAIQDFHYDVLRSAKLI